MPQRHPRRRCRPLPVAQPVHHPDNPVLLHPVVDQNEPVGTPFAAVVAIATVAAGGIIVAPAPRYPHLPHAEPRPVNGVIGYIVEPRQYLPTGVGGQRRGGILPPVAVPGIAMPVAVAQRIGSGSPIGRQNIPGCAIVARTPLHRDSPNPSQCRASSGKTTPAARTGRRPLPRPRPAARLPAASAWTIWNPPGCSTSRNRREYRPAAAAQCHCRQSVSS